MVNDVGTGTGADPAPGRVTQRRVRAGTSVADEGSRDPLLLVRTPEGVGRQSAGGYRIAVEGHRWRPADEQERSRLTRIAVDRGAEPQTVRVISAPLILDGPRHPGVERSSHAHRAVMDMIEGRGAGGVKDLRSRFTHTDICAGQRHSRKFADVVALPPLATLTRCSPTL